MEKKKVSFNNANGQTLAARLDLPLDEKPKAYAIFCHYFTGSKDLKANQLIDQGLARSGIAVLRFDFTGLGQSEGVFGESTFSNMIADVKAAANFLADEYAAPSMLIGHSLGGAVALHAAGQIDSVQAVVSIAAPCDPDHVLHLFGSGVEELKEKGETTINVGGREFLIKKPFLDDLQDRYAKHVIKDLRMPLLIFHSPQDTVVGIQNAANIYGAAVHPKSFISLDGADHMMSNKRDALYVGEVIASWATRYLDLDDDDPDIPTEGQVLARLEGEGFTTEIQAGRHALLADEPKSVGGADLGPSPYGFVSAGLGACTAMTLRMYAERKKWDLQEVRVHLDHDKQHVTDCEDCDNAKSKIDVFERKIELIGELDEKQRERLLQIADKCPVHRTLEAKATIRTTLI